jgi:hypothetical protein
MQVGVYQLSKVSLRNLCLDCVFQILVEKDQWRSWGGRLVQPHRTAECKGRQHTWQNEYFKFINVILCARQLLNF